MTQATNENIPGEKMNKPRFTRQLPVKLSERELAQRAKGVGEKGLELDRLRADVAEKKKALSELVKTKETEFDREVATLRNGTEDRIVPCHDRFHAGTIITVREDINEVVGSPRPATPAERQIALPGEAGSGLMQDAAAEQKKTDKKKQTGFAEDDDKKPFNPPRRSSKGHKTP